MTQKQCFENKLSCILIKLRQYYKTMQKKWFRKKNRQDNGFETMKVFNIY